MRLVDDRKNVKRFSDIGTVDATEQNTITTPFEMFRLRRLEQNYLVEINFYKCLFVVVGFLFAKYYGQYVYFCVFLV